MLAPHFRRKCATANFRIGLLRRIYPFSPTISRGTLGRDDAKGSIMARETTEQKRSSERYRTRFGIIVKGQTQRYDAAVVDISETGMCIATHTANTLAPGEEIQIASRALGYVNATVRWRKLHRVGVEFDRNSNTAAKIKAFFKYYTELQAA